MAEPTPTPPSKAPRRAAAARARAVSRGVAAGARAGGGGRPAPVRPLPLVDAMPLPLSSMPSSLSSLMEEDLHAPSSNGDVPSSGGAPGSPGKAKRVLANRQSAQRSRMRKLQFISNLEANVDKVMVEVGAMAPRVSAARRDAAAATDAHREIAAAAADAQAEAERHWVAIEALKARLPRAKLAALPPAPPTEPPFGAAAFAPSPGLVAAAAAAAAVDDPIELPVLEPLPVSPKMAMPPPVMRAGRGSGPPHVRTAAGLRAASPLGGVFGSLDSPFGFRPDEMRLTPMTPLEFQGAAF